MTCFKLCIVFLKVHAFTVVYRYLDLSCIANQIAIFFFFWGGRGGGGGGVSKMPTRVRSAPGSVSVSVSGSGFPFFVFLFFLFFCASFGNRFRLVKNVSVGLHERKMKQMELRM